MISISDIEFNQLREYIQVNYGIYLKDEKKTFVIGRLHNVLTQMEFVSFTEYYKYLLSDQSGEAVTILLDKITTNHTFFMREAEHFYYLRDYVLPEIRKNIRNSDLRVWCAASSTGEEPYTLAMIINDYTKATKLDWDKKILATDIAPNVLKIAKRGVYSNEKLVSLPKYWQLSYFEKFDSDNMVVKDEHKKEVIFRRLNLMDNEFPFKKKLHIIFCRNVMIYFDNKTKDILIQKMSDLLEKGGYLFIGHSESISKDIGSLRYECPSVYKKI